MNDSGEVVARPYDPQDWEAGTAHKRVQRKGVKIKEGGGNISIDEDESSGWTKATKTTSGKTKTPKVTTPKLSDEDILRLREEAEQRRIEKEKEKDSSEDSTDEDSSLGGLFLDEQEVED